MAAEVFARSAYSRLPVYDGTVDKIVGILTLRHVLDAQDTPNQKISELTLVKPIFTPASRRIRSLLQEFRARRTHLAIVLDEHGGTQGIVTLEDLLEELVGEIEDEGDVPERGIERLSTRVVRVPGSTQLAEVDELLETHLASGEFESKNAAYLILEKLSRLPKEGDRIREADAELTVGEVRDNRIESVKIEKI